MSTLKGLREGEHTKKAWTVLQARFGKGRGLYENSDGQFCGPIEGRRACVLISNLIEETSDDPIEISNAPRSSE